MSNDRNSRRDFLRHLAVLAASGGAAALVPQLRMIGSALAQTPATSSGYKALVCVYLSGGNDAWNMLIPSDARYTTYAASRSGVYNATSNPGGLALDKTQLLALTGATGSGSSNYGMHPAMPELRTLYNAQKLAFVANVGTLVKPISKTEYSTTANRPPQLFSHSDQENLWHVGTARDSSSGWGGSSASLLKSTFPNANAMLSPCISVSGTNKFEVGPGTIPYQMSSGGLSNLSGVCNPTGCSGTSGQRDVALNLILSDTYQSTLAGGYAQVLQRGRDLFGLLNGGLTGPDGMIATTFPGGNSLADQLKMVARMIKLSRAQNYASRQIFYVRFGGFDLHAGLMSAGNGNHAALLGKVSSALSAFWNALGDIGAQSEVTAFTMSEFARTLSSNGSGSDHGWGSLQMVLGGAVQGGKLYADGGNPAVTGFPDQTINLVNGNNTNPVAFARGQFIPGIGVEQYAATLANWMGVADTNAQNAIFPNLVNFNPVFRKLGFLG